VQLRVLAEAMGHPLRAKLLFAIAEKSADGVSISQLAARLKEPKRRVRYHTDALVELGLVAIASERSRRGVVERFYRTEQTPIISTEQVKDLDEEQVRKISLQVLKAIVADASAAVGAKTFGTRPGQCAGRIPGEVDQQGWEDLTSIQNRALSDTQKVMAEARKRLKGSEEKPIQALAAMLLFEVPEWPPS
jgi:DNA-binding transcriptional ArsR family regulator